MKLGIQLTSGIESEDVHTVRQLALAAVAGGHQVNLFLMDDGVYALDRLKDLARQGVPISLCTHSASERGVAKVEGILWGSQWDWAQIVHDSDRVLNFG